MSAASKTVEQVEVKIDGNDIVVILTDEFSKEYEVHREPFKDFGKVWISCDVIEDMD